MNVIDILIFIFGVGLISWVIYGKVKQMWHQIHMFKQLGGPEVGKYAPSKEEVRELVSKIVKKTKENKNKDCEQDKNNFDKGMYG